MTVVFYPNGPESVGFAYSAKQMYELIELHGLDQDTVLDLWRRDDLDGLKLIFVKFMPDILIDLCDCEAKHDYEARYDS